MRLRWLAGLALTLAVAAFWFGRPEVGALEAALVGTGEEPAITAVSTAPAAIPDASAAVAAAAQPEVLPSPEPPRPTPTPGQVRELVFDDYYVQVPAEVREPARVLVVLHGMGSEGKDFAAAFKAHCNSKHWVLVAPTFQYGDWKNPATVTAEGPPHAERLREILDGLPAVTGLQLAPRVALYGYSRGAQTAHRFAMVHPERIRSLAVLSAGSYTLPEESRLVDGTARTLAWPFGAANMTGLFGRGLDTRAFTAIRFWVGVGAADNDPNETPAAWDPYEGAGRATRAAAYVHALQDLGASVQFRVEPNMGHGPTDEVRTAALDFIGSQPL